MPIYRLTKQIAFPHPNDADADGLLAIEGDLSPQRVLLAYAQGIFPWPHEGLPLLWFSPDPRMVLLPSELHISRSLRRTINKGGFEVRFDTAFNRVMQACAATPRAGQDGTWVTDEMMHAYGCLHDLGFAHSAEVWVDGELGGGLYGVSLGAAFFGESMFAQRSNASKVAFVHLVRQLHRWGFHFVDCQMHTDHLARFGAIEWSRRRFLQALNNALLVPTRRGAWTDINRGEAGILSL